MFFEKQTPDLTPEEEEMMGKMELEEKRRRSATLFHFILSIALIISSSLYLANINLIQDIKKSNVTLTMTMINKLQRERSQVDASKVDLSYLDHWESIGIVGVIRGGLYILQIYTQMVTSALVYQRSHGQPVPWAHQDKRSRNVTFYTILLNFCLGIVTLYLAIALVWTKALNCPVGILVHPAITIFVICVCELIGLSVFLVCCVPIAIDVISSNELCSWDDLDENNGNNEEEIELSNLIARKAKVFVPRWPSIEKDLDVIEFQHFQKP